ncbi:MAG: putative metalloprotease CJM1_0395 family protein [Gammaproteobacteria bacterium]|nr:putative metalloprotease CJM1_0395 family protein [Gammaproteobacteria bacterium]
MLAPIFSDPAFNQRLMETQRNLRDAIATGASAVSVSPTKPSSTPFSTTPPATKKSSIRKSGDEVAKADPETRVTKESASSDKEERTDKPQSPTTTLSPQEQRHVSTLQEIDRRVRAHEQAHLNAAQGLAISRANFAYEVGPDKKRYAIAGEVTIDTSKESEPEKTINKGYQIIRTALAPADPSPQDRSVANNAQMMIQEAQAELIRESYEQNRSTTASQESGQQIDEQV